MKDKQPIPKRSAVPKRGTPYIYEGNEVWLYHVRNAITYIICNDKTFPADADYSAIHPDDLKGPKAAAYSSISSKASTPSPEKKKVQMNLSVFFADQIKVMGYLCDNCHQPLYAFNNTEKRACVAHILPKKEEHGFPEIALHPANKMFLCAKGGCHGRWDNTDADVRKTMACYPLAIEGFNFLKAELTQGKIIKACNYLGLDYREHISVVPIIDEFKIEEIQ